MFDIRKLSDAALKEIWTVMNNRLKSIAAGQSSEEEYETNGSDWQELYNQVKDELARRKII